MKVPKNKAELIIMLKGAYIAGCDFGAMIDHSCNVYEQEEIGASAYVGEISWEEAYDKLSKIFNDIDKQKITEDGNR